MVQAIRKHIDQLLEELTFELQDKHQGYTTELIVAGKMFRDMEPPRIRVVLLSPNPMRVAYARVSDPFRGEEKGDWNVGGLEEVAEEALSWTLEMEQVEDQLDRRYEIFEQ